MAKAIHKLNKKQILRLYQLFEFEDKVRITDGQLVCGKTLLIHYVDKRDGNLGTYMPTLEGKEGKDKLNFIMNGIDLERNR